VALIIDPDHARESIVLAVALIALVLYPLVWLLLLPFRLVGIAVGGALALVWALVTLPARVLRL